MNFEYSLTVLVLACCAGGCASSAAGPGGGFATKPQVAHDGAKSIAQVVEGTERFSGLVTVYRSTEKLFLGLDEAALGEELGFTAQLVDSVGDWSLRGTELDTQIVRWDLHGGRVVLTKLNLDFRAGGASNLSSVVDKSFPDSPVFQADRIPVTEDDFVLFEAGELFGPKLVEILPAASGFSGRPGSTTIRSVKSFSDNVVVRVGYRFEKNGKVSARGSNSPFERFMGPGRLPDAQNVEVTVDYHFFRLPKDDYAMRHADERIGGMTTSFKEYEGIDKRDSAFQHILVRWDLRKQDPEAVASPPVEPIVFYVDRGVPEEWRPLIHEGALWWNRAFENIGFIDAIQVLDQPDDPDWDPADLRHSMIYWNLSDNLIFSGLAGPMYSDPRTGKTLRANVYLNGEFPSYALHRYLVYAWWRAPVPGLNDQWEDQGVTPSSIREFMGSLRDQPGFCDRSASFSSQLAFARLVLQARGRIRPGTPEAKRFAQEAFRQLVAHEVGHALGFPHNWKASLGSTWEDLEHNRVTGSASKGAVFSTSVMDYNPIYIAPKGMEQGDYFMKEVGSYDRLAVEYIYRPFHGLSPASEARSLDAIAARAEIEPGLAFDGGGLGHIDPTTSADDLGDDPVAFADSRLRMLREEVLPHLPELVLAEGHDYQYIRQALDSAIFSVAMDYIDLLARHVGGQVLMRRVANSEASPAGGPPPIRPIEAGVQRRAIAALSEHVFAPGAFDLAPEMLSMLKADMQRDWNYPWRYETDYDVGSRIRGLFQSTWDTLLEPARLARVLDNERRVAEGEDRFTLPELFGTLDAIVFGESTPLDAERRALQRMWVDELSRLAFEPRKGTPAEASQLARRSLRRVVLTLSDAYVEDPYDEAHVNDLHDRITSLLEAKVQVGPLR